MSAIPRFLEICVSCKEPSSFIFPHLGFDLDAPVYSKPHSQPNFCLFFRAAPLSHPARHVSADPTATAKPLQITAEQPPISAVGGRASAPYMGESRSQLPLQPPALSAVLGQQPWDQNAALAALLGRGNSAGGHFNGAGRPMVAVVPQMDQAMSDTLPMLGHEPAPTSGACLTRALIF